MLFGFNNSIQAVTQNNIINIAKECMLMNGKMNMSISQIFQKDGKPTAFVLFSEGRKSAEGKIARLFPMTAFPKRKSKHWNCI